MSNKEEKPCDVLINLINNPTTIETPNQIYDLLNKVLKQNLNLIYDGQTYCQLSGEIIGNQKRIKLKLPNNQTFIVIQENLKTLIQTHCFINGRFDPFYQTIYGVQFLKEYRQTCIFTDPIDIEITDDILKLVYEGVEFDKLKEDIKNFYEENQRNMEDFIKNLPQKCHKTQNEIIFINDGFNVQSLWFSLEGALKMLEEDKEKLFSHQSEFLNNYKKQMKI